MLTRDDNNKEITKKNYTKKKNHDFGKNCLITRKRLFPNSPHSCAWSCYWTFLSHFDHEVEVFAVDQLHY